jgi:hypothetical protein
LSINWIASLVHFASISGALAGFCITFIALVLGGQVGDVDICTTGVTFGRISVLLFGTSAVFFIAAAQIFLHARETHTWDLPVDYKRFVKSKLEEKGKKWDNFLYEKDIQSKKYEKEGRIFYNLAILIMIGGLGFAIAPYSLGIALFVGAIGYLMEAWQVLR